MGKKKTTASIKLDDGKTYPLTLRFEHLAVLEKCDHKAYGEYANLFNIGSGGNFTPLEAAKVLYVAYRCGDIAEGNDPRKAMTYEDFLRIIPDDMQAVFGALAEVMGAPKATDSAKRSS